MTAITMNHFDVFNYVKKSKELGVSEQVAEYQARQIEQSIEIAVNTVRSEIENKELSTKGDIDLVRKDIEMARKDLEKSIETLRKEVAQINTRTIIWMGGFILASGLLQHFFK